MLHVYLQVFLCLSLAATIRTMVFDMIMYSLYVLPQISLFSCVVITITTRIWKTQSCTDCMCVFRPLLVVAWQLQFGQEYLIGL